jgi:NADH-quinone oxidoreductase subunit C
MDNDLVELGETISDALDNEIVEKVISHGELTITTRADCIVKVLTFLRDDSQCKFSQLIDIAGVDYPERTQRFDVVYHLLSMKQNQRVAVKVCTDEETPVPSVAGVFSTATWFERECWDMYGVMFSDNPDLRRILTDYAFQGFPLRKDFPLSGYVEVRYSDEHKRVVYEPVTLTQDLRTFDFMSPWEGAKYILPGDEKAEEAGEGEG